jgi:ABC-type multidrug transport system fused ATPase/permease subunit
VETHNKLNVFGKRKGRYQIKQIRDLNDYSKIRRKTRFAARGRESEQDFTDERWESFNGNWTLQTAYFNDDHSRRLGEKANDHGFNPPPFWTVIPTFVATRVDLADGPAYAWARVIDLSMLFLVCLLAAIFLGLDTGALMFIYAFTAWYYRNNFIAPFFNFMWLWTLALS